MFGKMQAISTAKPVSQNYASATGSARVVQPFHFWTDSKYPQTDIAVFHKKWIYPAERRAYKRLTNRFCKCRDVNSSTKGIQVNSVDFVVFLPHTFIIQIEVCQLRFYTGALNRLSCIENRNLIFS